jgi:hypothetical protein
MAIMTLGYFAANFQFIQHNYGVFTSLDPFNNAQGQGATLARTPTDGKLFNTYVELLFLAVLALFTICAVVRLLRRGLLMRALPFILFAVSPFFVLFGQNYGGEASLRIILFSSPWCAALISWALGTVVSGRLRWALTMFVAITFTALFIPSFLGEEELNTISPAEVSASEWFYYHARPGSVLVLAAPGFPYRYGGTYSEFRGPEGDANPNLLTEALFQGRPLGVADIPRVIARIKEYAPHGYLVFDNDETAFAEVFRITPPGGLGHLEAAVAGSPDFRLWYQNSNVRIYELTEPTKNTRRPTRTHRSKRVGRTNAAHNFRLVRPAAPTGKYVFIWRSPHVRSQRETISLYGRQPRTDG